MACAARASSGAPARAADVVTYSLARGDGKAEDTRDRSSLALSSFRQRASTNHHARYRRRAAVATGAAYYYFLSKRACHGLLTCGSRGGARGHRRSWRSLTTSASAFGPSLTSNCSKFRRAIAADGRAGAHRHRSESSVIAVGEIPATCAQRTSIDFFRAAIVDSKPPRAKDLAADLPRLLGLYHMGTSLPGVHESRGQRRTRALLDGNESNLVSCGLIQSRRCR